MERVRAQFEGMLLAQAFEPLLGGKDAALGGYGAQMFAEAIARRLGPSDEPA